MTWNLFDTERPDPGAGDELAPGAVVLRGFAGERERELLDALWRVVAEAPFRHMVTRRGYTMSVAMTNCGPLGWVSDRRGYRYAPNDPESGHAWPAMPRLFTALATEAAARGGYAGFVPDACLINRYEPGAKMALHQDRDERDFSQPIVSVSLGIPAIFLFGGMLRTDPVAKIPLHHGDVVVWGGASRLFHHGILPLKPDEHPMVGGHRINLTFRRAG